MSSLTLIAPDSGFYKLHNDYLHKITIDGKRYKSPTHFIYSAMMPDKFLAEAMGYQQDGNTARKKANGYLFGKKAKGERKLAQASEIVMIKGLEEGYRAVFSQPMFRDKLLGTNTEGIIYYPSTEFTFLPSDTTVIGLNRLNNGQNRIGEIIEEIRSDIKKDVLSRNKPQKELHIIDRVYFAILRRKILLEELKKGHFPSDYTLKGLYMKTKNILSKDFDLTFLTENPPHIRESYWNLFKSNKGGIDKEIVEEIKTGNEEWIAEEYSLYIKKKCILIEYLKFLNIDYNVLLISIAKQKMLNMYRTNRFDITTNAPISLEKYLKDNNITIDTLNYIGEEALADLRESVYFKYLVGEFLNLENFEENLASSIEGLRGLISQSIIFPKFVPVIENPSEKFLKLMADDIPAEPFSPRRTYGGISVSEYYAPIHPDGACSEDLNALCPLPIAPSGPSDDGGEGDDESDYDEGQDNWSGSEDEGDGVDENENEEENAVFVDNRNIDEAIERGKKGHRVIVKKYVAPVITIKFSDENDYPYEWLSPFYTSHIRIKGIYYPSVAHYVVAKLATPFQFRNVPIRNWVLKDLGKDATKSYDSPKYFHPIKTLIENLPTRIQEVYNLLYIRYASRAFDVKFGDYPFRQILNSTKGNIVYNDEKGQSAVAGKELAKLLTDLRETIKDVVEMTALPNPVYSKDNLVLYDYIRERTRELLRSTVLFTRYLMSPRKDHIETVIPIVSFDSIRFVLEQLYSSCRDINYNELVLDPPDRYVVDFESDLTEILALYFPSRTMYDTKHPDVINALRLKTEGLSEDDMNDKIFVAVKGIMNYVWIHIVYTCMFLEEELPIDYEQNQLRQRIKLIRTGVFNLNVGTRKEYTVNAILNVLEQIHVYFPNQTQLEDSDVEFILDFIYPFEYTRQNPFEKIKESEMYNSYNDLTERITKIFGGNEQSPVMIKKLTTVIDELLDISKDDKMFYNKLMIRLKFFASPSLTDEN